MKRDVEDWVHGRAPKLDLIDEVLQRVLKDEGLGVGRMISGSKSMYSEQYPGHTVFFNACIFIRKRKVYKWSIVLPGRYEYQQVWWGDLDLDIDGRKIQRAANLRKEPLYATREGHSWNGLTDKKVKMLLANSLYSEGIRIYRPE